MGQEQGMLVMEAGEWLKAAVLKIKSVLLKNSNSTTPKNPTTYGWSLSKKQLNPTPSTTQQ